MATDPTRAGESRPLGAALPGVKLPEFSDEDWAARDAELASAELAREAEAERKRQEALRVELAERGAPVKDLDRAISGVLESTRALAAVRRALAEGWLLTTIAGPRGIGKTTAATWWLVQEHPPARYVKTRGPRFVDAPTLSRWPRYEDDRMRELERARALVLDDLGAEYDDRQGAFRSLVDALINARYAACLPTLITTNLPAEDVVDKVTGAIVAVGFKTRYGERVADRIRESGKFVPLDGPSMRGRR